MEQCSAIVVDHDPLVREELSEFIEGHDGFSVLASCKGFEQAQQLIQAGKPDVLFVGVDSPDVEAETLLNALRQTHALIPDVVFVSASIKFAAVAFEQQAFDFLLKPYSHERLCACLEKIRHALVQRNAVLQQHALDKLLCKKTGKSLSGFIDTLTCQHNTSLSDMQHVIALKSGTEWLRIKLDSILWVEAAGDYACVHTDDGNHIIRTSLRQLHNNLCKQQFLRFNRSAIVNLSKVTRFTPNSNGEYTAQLCCGKALKISRRYKFAIKELNAR